MTLSNCRTCQNLSTHGCPINPSYGLVADMLSTKLTADDQAVVSAWLMECASWHLSADLQPVTTEITLNMATWKQLATLSPAAQPNLTNLIQAAIAVIQPEDEGDRDRASEEFLIPDVMADWIDEEDDSAPKSNPFRSALAVSRDPVERPLDEIVHKLDVPEFELKLTAGETYEPQSPVQSDAIPAASTSTEMPEKSPQIKPEIISAQAVIAHAHHLINQVAEFEQQMATREDDQVPSDRSVEPEASVTKMAIQAWRSA